MEPMKVSAILEILGKPEKNVKEAMEKIVDQLSKEKGIKILDKKINKPVPVKDSADLFTTFSDLSLEVDTVNHIFALVFKYMPSNLEITSPENIKIKNSELNYAANQLTQRMHSYDAITKNVLAERDFLAKKLQKHEPELFKEKKKS